MPSTSFVLLMGSPSTGTELRRATTRDVKSITLRRGDGPACGAGRLWLVGSSPGVRGPSDAYCLRAPREIFLPGHPSSTPLHACSSPLLAHSCPTANSAIFVESAIGMRLLTTEGYEPCVADITTFVRFPVPTTSMDGSYALAVIPYME